MPPWCELPEHIQDAWNAAVEAVVRKIVGGELLGAVYLATLDTRRLTHQVFKELRAMQDNIATRDQLDAGIATLQADDVQLLAVVVSSSVAIGASLQDLLDKIASNPGAPVSDFTAEVQAIATTHTDFQGAISKLQDIAATAGKDDPGPTAQTPAPSTLSISASPMAPDTSSTIILAGSVQGGTKVPTGSVTITDPTGAVTTSATLDSNGGFSATPVGPLAAGSYSVSASYGGDANTAASTTSLSITVTDPSSAQ